MSSESKQKFLGRNRPARVHIEYDVEDYGSTKKVELPFVMGVMADLSGKPATALPPVADRKFLEIDTDNFNDRMKAAKPRVAFEVKNTLANDGSNLKFDMTFENMADFSPAAVARRLDELSKNAGRQELLKTRTELANLLTYMDGKEKAEDLVAKLLSDPELMKSLAAAPRLPAPTPSTSET